MILFRQKNRKRTISSPARLGLRRPRFQGSSCPLWRLPGCLTGCCRYHMSGLQVTRRSSLFLSSHPTIHLLYLILSTFLLFLLVWAVLIAYVPCIHILSHSSFRYELQKLQTILAATPPYITQLLLSSRHCIVSHNHDF